MTWGVYVDGVVLTCCGARALRAVHARWCRCGRHFSAPAGGGMPSLASEAGAFTLTPWWRPGVSTPHWIRLNLPQGVQQALARCTCCDVYVLSNVVHTYKSNFCA